MFKEYDFYIVLKTSCYGIEGNSEEEAREKLKSSWEENYNIFLNDDEISEIKWVNLKLEKKVSLMWLTLTT